MCFATACLSKAVFRLMASRVEKPRDADEQLGVEFTCLWGRGSIGKLSGAISRAQARSHGFPTPLHGTSPPPLQGTKTSNFDQSAMEVKPELDEVPSKNPSFFQPEPMQCIICHFAKTAEDTSDILTNACRSRRLLPAIASWALAGSVVEVAAKVNGSSFGRQGFEVCGGFP